MMADKHKSVYASRSPFLWSFLKHFHCIVHRLRCWEKGQRAEWRSTKGNILQVVSCFLIRERVWGGDCVEVIILSLLRYGIWKRVQNGMQVLRSGILSVLKKICVC